MSRDLGNGSSGPSRFANAGRPARSGIICRFFLTRSHYFPQPGRVPVNPGLATVYPGEAPAEPQLSSVMPGGSPGESRQRSCRAPVYRNSTDTHRGYTGIIPWQSYGGAPVNAALSGLCRHSPGLHRGKTGDNRGVAVALRGSVWAPVELRCRPGCSRCLVPGEAPVHPGRARITHRGSAGIIVRLGLKKSTSQYLY
ncbi:hypothetical protein DPMN_085543 [Dreissena polymorpha]|uniref:Uncharacterized protein n=1 Tax=Dreissena polymorpha TaxID=45954 RepID=A0A9D3YCX1_DREPO|nr:hypothetical protein DPMN_085543 [Dreissena polymorpha]